MSLIFFLFLIFYSYQLFASDDPSLTPDHVQQHYGKNLSPDAPDPVKHIVELNALRLIARTPNLTYLYRVENGPFGLLIGADFLFFSQKSLDVQEQHFSFGGAFFSGDDWDGLGASVSWALGLLKWNDHLQTQTHSSQLLVFDLGYRYIMKKFTFFAGLENRVRLKLDPTLKNWLDEGDLELQEARNSFLQFSQRPFWIKLTLGRTFG